jgi:hypothetical protein
MYNASYGGTKMIGKIERFDAVVSLVGGTLNQKADGIIYYVDGQTPPSDEEIDAEVIRLQAEYDSNEYQRSRATEYPTWQDQLDDIFHNGIDGWKATIQVTKDKYPKG